MILALFVLAGGLCLFDHDGDGTHDHAMPQDLCWVLLVVSAVILLVSPLAARGFVADMSATEPIELPLSVLVPPPRAPRSA